MSRRRHQASTDAQALRSTRLEERHQQFLGSICDVERAQWNQQSDQHSEQRSKPFQDERDYGFSIGGRRKPGGANKLFFFSRWKCSRGGGVTHRMPTLERQAISPIDQRSANIYIKDLQTAPVLGRAAWHGGSVVGRIRRARSTHRAWRSELVSLPN